MRRIVHLLIILFFTYNGFAYQTALSFKRINVEDGLSQSWVRSIEQDSLGFMWFGTSDGLNKYDGYTFTIYKNDFRDSLSLINNHIQALEFDNKNRLWIGTAAGLCRFDARKDKFSTVPNFPTTTINTLFCHKHLLYIGTFKGLYIYDTEKEELLYDRCEAINRQFRNRDIYSFEIDANENVWIGTEAGVYVMLPHTDVLETERAKGNTVLQKQRITALKQDTYGRMWIGTEENGLYVLIHPDGKVESEKLLHYKNCVDNSSSLTTGTIKDIHQDKKGRLWIGSENGGLDMISLGEFHKEDPIFHHHYFDASQDNSLSNNSIYRIFEDFRGDLWIGTYGNGLNHLNIDGANFKTITHKPYDKNSLSNNFVNAIQKSGEELWIGTEGGISVLNLKTNIYKHYQHEPGNEKSLSSNAVMSLFHDDRDDVWVGTWAGGINKLEKGSNVFQRFTYSEDASSIGADNVFTIRQDENGTLWFAVMGGGLTFYNKGNLGFSKILHDQGLEDDIASNWIRDVCIDDSLVWFSTDLSVGYYNYKKETIKNFYPNREDAHALNGNGAFDIFKDSKGTIWFGTDVGLNYYDRTKQHFVAYHESDGLPNNSVKAIEEDDKGNLWLGTNKGLSKFVNGVLRPVNPVFINYDQDDGLQGNEFNRRAAFKDEQGVLYFGGANGVNYFHPDSIRNNLFLPKLAFTNFEVFNKDVKIGGEDGLLDEHISFTKAITLTHKHSMFTIEFAALSFVGKEKNRYEYMLQGFESVWNKVGAQREATFTNLDAGDYIFKVRACNNSGIWTESPLELKIKVLPPWWKSMLAMISYLVILLSSIYLFIRVTMSRLKAQQTLSLEREQRIQIEKLNKRKIQFFTNISHEFRTPLTLISSPLEDILRNQQERLPEDLKQKFSIIYKNALRLNRLIGELMDFRKIQFNKLNLVVYNQELEPFVENISQLFSQEAEDNQIHLEIINPGEKLKAWFDPSMIEKVLFNLISNAFKVTPEDGSIQIFYYETMEKPEPSINDEKPWTCISVKNTGPELKKEEINKIFDRFYHSDEHTKTYYSSTGIGLSLARNIMEMHHGYLTVRSEEGKGVEFIVWLRHGKDHFKQDKVRQDDYQLKEQSFTSTNSPVRINESKTGLKGNNNYSLLIVEDNAELRKYLKTELNKSFKVWTARHGEEGIESALKYFPDIVISDINMPVKNGFELCKEMKSNVKLSHIPIILLTARVGVDDQVKGLENGADAFIVKPFNMRVLKAKIKQLAESREQLLKKYSTNLNLLSDEKEIGSVDRNFLKEVNQYIMDNISNSDLSVEQLGDKMTISRSQLYRKIKALSGMSANEYIRNVRLETARKFITTHQYSINEVVYNVGFSSPSYFSKCYKEYFGKLPSEE